jgi:hypothetical protein
MRILLIPALCLPLLTSGCFVGDGIAHVVKLAEKSGKKSDDSSQTASTQPVPAPAQPAPASAGPIDRDPAPMPAAAPAGTGIQSEDLPPPF